MSKERRARLSAIRETLQLAAADIEAVAIEGDKMELHELFESIQLEDQSGPLSWDQIECLSGKPVWVESLDKKNPDRWEIIAFVQENTKRENDGRVFVVYAGDYWKMFRYQRDLGILYNFYLREPRLASVAKGDR